MSRTSIKSLQALIEEVVRDRSGWTADPIPWFRGEPSDVETPLLPRLFRPENGRKHHEKKLLHHFRMKAPSLGLPYVPPREYTDQWLFLAQHVRLPTRLLDWTEGLLIALHFALHTHEDGSVVWMLNPDALNKLSVDSFEPDQVQLTWFDQRTRQLQGSDLEEIQKIVMLGSKQKKIFVPYNISTLNINFAWTQTGLMTPFPFAIPPTNIHPRMSSQISRFTIHGNKKLSMPEMDLGEGVLQKYTIAEEAIPAMKTELRMMGITHSSLFPELDGLSDELAEIY
ncbi:MAG: FRG domain-containing protein [Chloroflexi bacterium]|nr:FRG domain-containing protein [Chloroflexota bacterium]